MRQKAYRLSLLYNEGQRMSMVAIAFVPHFRHPIKCFLFLPLTIQKRWIRRKWCHCYHFRRCGGVPCDGRWTRSIRSSGFCRSSNSTPFSMNLKTSVPTAFCSSARLISTLLPTLLTSFEEELSTLRFSLVLTGTLWPPTWHWVNQFEKKSTKKFQIYRPFNA